jgi:ZIP family zinc transporter
MLEAALWGAASGSSLVIGAVIGLRFRFGPRAIGLIMGFGSGVLISALAFELTEEAFAMGGTGPLVVGLLMGALSFFGADWYLDRRGGEHRKRSGGQQKAGRANAIVAGALMDGIPESFVIGIALLHHPELPLALVAAVFLSNVPESLSAATGLRTAGHSRRSIIVLWSGVMLASAFAAAAGYGFLGGASDEVIAGVQAFAAGAILTMLADTMMPEAFEGGGNAVGLVTVVGFATAFLLATAA